MADFKKLDEKLTMLNTIEANAESLLDEAKGFKDDKDAERFRGCVCEFVAETLILVKALKILQ